MGKDSTLYQLMDVRMYSVMNGIVSSDGEYQAIIQKSDEYSGRLDGMELPKEVRHRESTPFISRNRRTQTLRCSCGSRTKLDIKSYFSI